VTWSLNALFCSCVTPNDPFLTIHHYLTLIFLFLILTFITEDKEYVEDELNELKEDETLASTEEEQEEIQEEEEELDMELDVLQLEQGKFNFFIDKNVWLE
jgi:hypothetical protein